MIKNSVYHMPFIMIIIALSVSKKKCISVLLSVRTVIKYCTIKKEIVII